MRQSTYPQPSTLVMTAACSLIALLLAVSAVADNEVTFHDIVADGTANLVYARTPSPRLATLEALTQQPTYLVPQDVIVTPLKPRGIPGIVVLDYDGDGDEDLYVTNGPGTSNSLFANRLYETGNLVFEDVGDQAGVGAIDQDSSGAVAGDLDNDGDPDLYVLGTGEANRLFENLGNGHFVDITAASGTAAGTLDNHTSATLGDLDGDGLVDIIVGGASTFETQPAIFFPFVPENVPNTVFMNRGGLVFTDESEASGIRVQGGLLPEFAHAATLTHAIAAVDIDLDGDVDVITADDQAAVPSAEFGGTDQGVLHVFENDGSGQLVDTTAARGLDETGAWMGLSFGDFDRNGRLDLFGSNFGSYATDSFGLQLGPDRYNSRWYLQQSDGTFVHPGLGALGATPFGWGTSAADFDNDGDTDLIFHGGLDVGPFVLADNPGTLLINDGQAEFRYDANAFEGSVDHQRRIVHGVATSDLNQDGFVDIISVSNFDAPPPIPLVPFPGMGSPFDATATLIPTFVPTATPGVFVFNDALPPFPDGSLSIEISSGNANGSVAVDVVGSIGLTGRGRVNRDGIGAVVRFRPHGGKSVLRPIIAGSSYASQDSLTANFGLGSARFGRVEVLWPGGVRNRLYGAYDGERIRFPEIPVSFDDPNISLGLYLFRVKRALRDLRRQGEISRFERRRFFISAFLAFLDERY